MPDVLPVAICNQEALLLAVHVPLAINRVVPVPAALPTSTELLAKA
jgi:hypothetical protein